jgi:tetratricopeptide (TPR) repeat protein
MSRWLLRRKETNNEKSTRLFLEAEKYYRLGEYDIALRQARESLRLHTRGNEKTLKYQIEFLLSRILLRMAKLGPALEHARRAADSIAKDALQDSPTFLFERGRLNYYLALAEQRYAKSVKGESKSGINDIIEAYGCAANDYRKYLEARQNPAVTRYLTEILYSMSSLYRRTGQRKLAIECLETLLYYDDSFRARGRDPLLNKLRKEKK